ncbi:FtsX-like permease family protein [Mucilaginibacter achroorhodeus]|uniref:FtsX-like permease family protein n=1 Tax=Mucilaginibacter achroorhodeus TaxID=2599294 RepID=A0A563U400_9SPHI|nr:ABC transporter permease [Mucilaginibacter achroorhodeus]TWR26055.1 FtsX-like permease family protein [Mucilaginibacter achroorhodeus]
MILNYLKTAWRNILSNKFYAAINVTGLTVGLVVGIFMLLWVQDELSFDRFNSKADNIYKVGIVGGTGLSKQIFSNIIAPVSTFAKNELPDVKDGVRIMAVGDAPFKYKDKVFYEDNFCFTDPSYFSVFDFPLIKGDKRNPFPDNNTIVITESTAKKYFGTEDPIGKTVIIGQNEPVSVTGVIADYPKNSSFQYRVMLPLSRFNYLAYIKNKTSYDGKTTVQSMDADWSSFSFQTYLLTKPNTKAAKLEKELQAIHERQKPEDAPVPYLTQPLPQMHLYQADGTDGGMSTVRMFAIVAVMILVIACINYVNLSTARSMLRAKEVSIRKIIGAGKFQLFMQFMVETALLFALAAAVAIALMFILLPYYNQFSGKQIALNITSFNVWACVVITLIGTLTASSIYPALLLSSFEPLKALKGKVTAGIGTAAFRRILVVLQFSVSVVLIVSTLIIGKQLKYVFTKDLGYDKENIITFNMRDDMHKHADAVMNELKKDPSVLAATVSSRNMVVGGSSTGNNDWDGKPKSSNLWFNQIHGDKNLIDFFKIKLIQGSNFTGVVADSSHFIINETAVKEMGLSGNVIGKRLRIQTINGTIIGVVKDFHFQNLHKKIEPVVFQYNPANSWRVYLKITNANAQRAIAISTAVWKQYNNDVPFNYAFLDDSYRRIYSDDSRQGQLFNIFSAIAIVISCLGLFGLATYSAQVKTREIGIRKVLGASVARIITLLAREFMILIALSTAIGLPVAWYAMNKWLQDFAYKTNIGWAVFAFAAFAAAAVALATISVQSIKAALANPVKSLRSE